MIPLVERPSALGWAGPARAWLDAVAGFLGGVATVALALRFFGGAFGLSHDPSLAGLVVVVGALFIVMVFPFGADLPEQGWRRWLPHWSVGVGIGTALVVVAMVGPKFVPPNQPTALEWELLGAGAAFASGFIGRSPNAAALSPAMVLGFVVGLVATAVLAWTLHGATFLSADVAAEPFFGLGAVLGFVILVVGIIIVGSMFWIMDKLIARSERRETENQNG